MTVTERIIRLLDRRTETRGKDPKAYEKASLELLEIKRAEPTAWEVAMRWIGLPLVLVCSLVGSGCAMPIATTPVGPTEPGTARPMAGVRVEWTADGLVLTPYVRAGAFGQPGAATVGRPENAATRGARSLGEPVRVPPPRGCPGPAPKR